MSRHRDGDPRFPIRLWILTDPHGRTCENCMKEIPRRATVAVVDPDGWSNIHCSLECAELDREALLEMNS